MDNKTIYISRRCEHCHELLILLHKNRDIIKIPVVDVDTKSFPKIVKSVPCMVIENTKILPGVELFKYIEYLIKNTSEESSSPSPEKKPSELLPNHNNGLMVPGNMRNLNEQPSDSPDVKPQSQGDVDLPGFCIGGSCELGFSSINEDEDIKDGSFEYLEGNEETKTCSLDFNKNEPVISSMNEKTQQLDNDYNRMMQQRRL